MKKKIEEPKTESVPPTAEDLAFEAELMKRHPNRRRIIKFDFPSVVEEAASVYIFEMSGKDELHVAEQTDLVMTDHERGDARRAIEAEQREAVRYSVCALVDRTGARRIVDQSAPLMELDDWSSKALAMLRSFHAEVNGIPRDELGKAVRGGRKLAAASSLPGM